MARMSIAHLKCFQCGHSFPINTYHQLDKISCPYCDTEVNEEMIKRITEARGYVAEVNHDFDKYSGEYGEPQFGLSISLEEVKFPLEDIDAETE